MPIIDIQFVTAGEAGVPPAWAPALAEAIGAVLQAPSGRVWVRVAALPAGSYAENGVTGDPADPPVFVGVLHARAPLGDARATEALVLARTVAQVIGRSPDRVHVLYAPDGAGRVAFGGRLLT